MKYFKHLGTEFHHFVIYTQEKSVELLSYSLPEITIDNIERWENGSGVKSEKSKLNTDWFTYDFEVSGIFEKSKN